MNTKKNKSKKRHNKVPNPIPPQKIDAIQKTDETVDLKSNIKPESAPRDDRETKICEQITSPALSLTDSEKICEQITLPAPSLTDNDSDTPKKPKRNKGKKNNQDKGHGVTDEKNENIVPEVDVVGIEKEQTTAKEVFESTESTEVAPTARKNKKKGKKNAEALVELKSEEVVSVPPNKENKTLREIIPEDIEQEVSAQGKEVIEDSKSSKKKNKKKKHRNDSEKSDKSEVITCTSAFKMLLEDDVKNIVHDKPDDSISTQVEDSSTSEATVKEISEKDTFKESGNVKPSHQTDTSITLETFTQEEVQEELPYESMKNKKKNKKEKKQASKKEGTTEILSKSPMELPIEAEAKPSLEQFSTQTNEENKSKEREMILDSELIKEKSPKPKAKIARPVEKKSKIRTEIDVKESSNITEDTIDKTILKQPIVIPNTERAEDESTEIKGDDKFSLQKPDAVIEKIEDNTLEADLKIPLRSETTKRRSKSPKLLKNTDNDKYKEANVQLKSENKVEDSNTKTTATSEQKTETSLKLTILEEIKISGLTPETSEASTCDFVPDFIEHPRSISEQSIDTNNNMVIQELLPTPELKSTVEPVFQDTTKLLTVSPVDDIKLAELDLATVMKTPKEGEKFDLKSKMMEVNQDMEGLKLSIEKSLAELKALEKNEEFVEKPKEQFQKVEKELADVKEIVKNEPRLSSIPTEETIQTDTKDIAPPIPARKDHKGKSKSKKKVKQEVQSTSASVTVTTTDKNESQSSKGQESNDKSDEKRKDSSEEQGKKHSDTKLDEEDNGQNSQDFNSNENLQQEYEPIENFEDAMSSSVDDVNQTFEIIVSEANLTVSALQNNPEINIIAPSEEPEKEDKDEEQAIENSVPQPKNLLGHPDIPVSSNKTDYKKEKNKTPNAILAKVKIKDCDEIEKNDTKKQSKESQTLNKPRSKSNDKVVKETVSCITNGDEEYVYKYSFRKVFLQSCCHVCKKELKQIRVPCQFCSLIFYCSHKHKDEDWAKHQALCFTVSTIIHLRNQKHIYADAKGVTGQDYRLLRMQMILSCEKILKRMMLPWEQEALLYPRMCADVNCRQWHQSKLKDCEGCGQISYCSKNTDHLPKSHQRWCKSYALYQKLVCHQQTKGRLEPKLPTRVMKNEYKIPDKINEVLASMFEEKIDLNDMQYAALTQLATAPITAVYCHQLYTSQTQPNSNGVNKCNTFILHIVGAELQFEADVLNKWETFFLHLRPDIKELRVVLISPDLNPSNLPLDLLGKVRLCVNCTQNKRRIKFDFQDKKNYFDYWASDDFLTPDLVCAFNASIQRASTYNGRDPWPSAINSVLKMKVPLAITSYTLAELKRDLGRIKQCAAVNYKVIAEPKPNPFASVRPDRNFISDDEMPLLFKNFCFMIVCGDF